MNRRVLVIGNNTVDHVFSLRTAVVPGTKMAADAYRPFAGGQAANAAVDMALLGLDVSFVGAFGDDAWGQFSAAAFRAAGVAIDHSVVVAGCPQHVAVVLAEATRSTIAMHGDAKLALDATTLPADVVASCAAVYTDGHEIDASLRLAWLAARTAVPLVSDLEIVTSASRRLIAATTHLVAPAYVVCEAAGTDEVEEALRAIVSMGPIAAVATRGEAGAVAFDEADGVVRVPAAPCRATDTTGAGDAFHAAYVAALVRGATLRERLHYASRIAALKCETPGPRLTAHALTVHDRIDRPDQGAALW